MASGEPSEERGTIETQPSTSQGASPPETRQGEAVRTALWAIVVAVLSNAANILKQLRDVLESVLQLQQFVQEHLWISVVVLGIVLAWGNWLLFRFLYHRLKGRVPTGYRVLAVVACVAVVSLVLVSNLFSLKSLLRGQTEVQQALASELATTQDPYEGGFKNAVAAAGFPDSWTTAQSIKAALLAGNFDPQRIKRAFTYVEAHRQSEGFEASYEPDGNSAFIRTEASDWVAIAYLESLSTSGLWEPGDRPLAIARTESTLQLILDQQDRAKGGWSPIPQFSAHNARTYATLMAVWALTEGMLSPDVSASTKQKLGPALEGGVSWLLNHYETNVGWEENPKYRLDKLFPGLTYQVLFVLERAQRVSGYNAFANTETYKSIKREFRNTIRAAEVVDQKSVPTEYIVLSGHNCAVDVLAFPWLLSVLPVLIQDPDVPSRDHRYLRELLQHELGKVPSLPNELQHAETWQVAEDLIGLSNFIDFNRKRK